MEQWLPVVGYEGRYSVSNLGNVRSEPRVTVTSRGSWSYPGVLLTPMDTKGRKIVTLTAADTSRKRLQVHRLVLEAFVGPAPEGTEALHWNDDASDNSLVNLRWGTASENMRDRVRNGRHHNARKVNCLRGHTLTGRNLLPAKTRQCKICSRAHSWRRKGIDFEVALAYWEGVYID